MKQISITYNDKEYKVEEPSLEMWIRLSAWKDILEEQDFVLRLISEATGLNEDEIKKADWYDIMMVGSILTEYLTQQSEDFHNEFEFAGNKYRFIDLPNLTFGEFIDIDTVLSREEHERKMSLNVLMAMLYREVGKDGKLIEYDSAKVQERAELFKKLPVKYLHGAMSFFLRLEKILQKPSLKFLVIMKWIQMKKKIGKLTKKVSQSIGGGLAFLRQLRTKTLGKWVKSPNTP